MKTKIHTKDQRRRLFLLARILDRTPIKKFDMRQWVTNKSQDSFPDFMDGHSPKECGFAGCAIGWARTSESIRGGTRTHESLIRNRLGMQWRCCDDESPATKLFGGHRKVGPRKVANDIRRYLKDGTLPTN